MFKEIFKEVIYNKINEEKISLKNIIKELSELLNLKIDTIEDEIQIEKNIADKILSAALGEIYKDKLENKIYTKMEKDLKNSLKSLENELKNETDENRKKEILKSIKSIKKVLKEKLKENAKDISILIIKELIFTDGDIKNKKEFFNILIDNSNIKFGIDNKEDNLKTFIEKQLKAKFDNNFVDIFLKKLYLISKLGIGQGEFLMSFIFSDVNTSRGHGDLIISNDLTEVKATNSGTGGRLCTNDYPDLKKIKDMKKWLKEIIKELDKNISNEDLKIIDKIGKNDLNIPYSIVWKNKNFFITITEISEKLNLNKLKIASKLLKKWTYESWGEEFNVKINILNDMFERKNNNFSKEFLKWQLKMYQKKSKWEKFLIFNEKLDFIFGDLNFIYKKIDEGKLKSSSNISFNDNSSNTYKIIYKK